MVLGAAIRAAGNGPCREAGPRVSALRYTGRVPALDSLPLTSRYLSQLPKGLDSYPDAQIKGSVVRTVLEHLPEGFELERLPPELGGLLEHPPLASEWVPDAPMVALTYAFRDVFFQTDEAYFAWLESGYVKMLDSRLYRIIMALSSPERLAKGADKRWGALRRGSVRELIHSDERHNIGVVRYPESLFPRFHAVNFMSALLVAYRLSRARKPRVDLLEWTPTQMTLRVIYDEDKPPPGADMSLRWPRSDED